MSENIDTSAVWEQFHQRLLAFIVRRTASRDDAIDILQNVFLRIQANAGNLADVESVSGWVYRITHNAIADYHRARGKPGTGNDASLDQATVAEIPAATTTSAEGIEGDPGEELARCIRPLLQRLPEPYRQAVSRTDLEGLSQQQAATEAGISLSGMKSRVQRGRARLKEALLECCRVDLDPRRKVREITPNDPRRGDCGDCK